jgi:hypothetical protein
MTNFEQLDLFTRLETLPWQALRDAAIDSEVPNEEADDKTKEELIQVLIQRGISEDRVKKMMDRYAYGKTVTFTLWHLDGISDENMFNQLEELKSKELEIRSGNFRKLKICTVDDRIDRAEVVYKYSKKHMYLDENGLEQVVWEQHMGCVWIGKHKPYIAVIGKDEKVWSRVADIISSALSRKNTPIRPPQKAIDRCFATAIKSKVTLVGQDGDRVTIARAEGFTSEQEQDAARYSETRKRVSGGFKTNIGEHQNVSARFNATRGNITIQKYLPAEDLFAWTQDAITIILEEIGNLKGLPAQDVFAAVGKEITWPGIIPEHHLHLEWVLTQLINAPSETDSIVVDVPEAISTLLEDERYFIAAYRPHCIQCDAPVAATCSECNAILTVYNVRGLECPNCGSLISEKDYRLVCSEGHRLPVYNHKHCWFIPNPNLVSKIETNLQKVFPGITTARRWYIGNMQMVIHPERAQAQEIPFNSFNAFTFVNGNITDDLRKWVTTLKEKCSGSSAAKCTRCVTAIENICLMRIFNPVIPRFRPQPHRGGEYGDISGQLVAQNQTLEIKGIIKSNTKSRSSEDERISAFLLSSTTAGQEIIRQIVEQGLVDARCNVIAIVAPQYIDAGFKGTLRFLCGLGGKSITFWELDELCHIAKAFKESFGQDGQPVPAVVSLIP